MYVKNLKSDNPSDPSLLHDQYQPFQIPHKLNNRSERLLKRL